MLRTFVFIVVAAIVAAAQSPAKRITAPAVAARQALAATTDKLAANVTGPNSIPPKANTIKLGEKPLAQPAPELKPARPAVKTMSGKRDPFVSVIQTRSVVMHACTTGKKCLPVNEIVLKGVVKGPAGMMAVVENGQRKAYFLRENDLVFNAQVMRITSDSVIFREKVIDRAGREMQREVVKRVTAEKPAA